MEWKKYKTVIAAGVFFLAVVPLSVFGVIFLLDRINEKVEKFQEEVVRVEGRTQRLSLLSEFRSQYENIRAKEGDLRALVRRNDVVALIQRIETIAQDAGVNISIAVIDVEKETKKKKDKDAEKSEYAVEFVPTSDAFLALRITLIGTFADDARFLHRMETIEYSGDIMRILAVKKENDSKKNVTAGSVAALSVSGEMLDTATEEENIPNPVEMQLDMVFYLEDEDQ
ncbi:MAG TPA: hypothetical protein VJL38_01745 [Patescibacteria group bacterium]|nr:hypothetical protein [Patescibacteria group bacterium]